MLNPMDLTGKSIMVVGACSDLGRSLISRLSCLGAGLILIDRCDGNERSTCSDFSGNTVFYNIDLYQNVNIESALRAVMRNHDPLDGFVFCGGFGVVRPLSFTKVEVLQEMMNVNYYSFVEFVRILIKTKAFKHGGSIVAISSVSSVKGLKSKLAYSASKAALDSSVRCLAAELGDKGIRVNSILKGVMSSDKQMEHIKNLQDLNTVGFDNLQFLGNIEPDEVSNFVSFLLSDAVRTLTGTSILLDGGFCL